MLLDEPENTAWPILTSSLAILISCTKTYNFVKQNGSFVIKIHLTVSVDASMSSRHGMLVVLRL